MSIEKSYKIRSVIINRPSLPEANLFVDENEPQPDRTFMLSGLQVLFITDLEYREASEIAVTIDQEFRPPKVGEFQAILHNIHTSKRLPWDESRCDLTAITGRSGVNASYRDGKHYPQDVDWTSSCGTGYYRTWVFVKTIAPAY